MSICKFPGNIMPYDYYDLHELKGIEIYVNMLSVEHKIEFVSRYVTNKGNNKIGDDTLIFNMGPTINNCPSEKLGLCAACEFCYAKKSEILRKATYKYKQIQKIIWKTVPVELITIAVIKKIRKNKTRYFRFNESCDFYNQSCVQKIDFIARELLKYDIQTYGYTARNDLIYDNVMFTINGSGFMLDNQFTIVDKFDDKISKFKCKSDCTICKLCKSPHKILIQVEKH